jgi:cbb3-type cytochrome oxidase subunit 1
MKRYFTLLGGVATVFCTTYVMPAIVATVITLDLSVYTDWVCGCVYTGVMGLAGFFASLFYTIVKLDSWDRS